MKITRYDLGTFLLRLPQLTYVESVQSVISNDYIAASGAVGTADDANGCVHPYAIDIVMFVNCAPRRVPGGP